MILFFPFLNLLTFIPENKTNRVFLFICGGFCLFLLDPLDDSASCILSEVCFGKHMNFCTSMETPHVLFEKSTINIY